MPKIVDHEQRRSELCSAACAEIARVGIERARLADIAARAGCTTGSLVHYFRDKRSLLLGALDHAVERMEGRMRTHLERTPPDYFGFFREALPVTKTSRIDNLVWHHFWTAALSDPVVRRRQRLAHRRWIATVAQVLSAMAAADEAVRADRAEAVAALVNGLMVRVLLDPDEWSAERQSAVLRLSLERLLAPSPSGPKDAPATASD